MSEQLLVGLATATVMAIADAIQAARGPVGDEALGLTRALAGLHLLAFYMPAGIALGLAAALLIAIARRTPALTPLRTALSGRGALLRASPRPLASVLGVIVGLGALGLGARFAHTVLVTRTHRVDLAAWAMGGISVGLAVAALLVGAAAAAALRPVLERVGRAASPLAFFVVLIVAAAFATGRFLGELPELAEAYGLERLLWGPATLLVYLGLTVLIRRPLRRRPRRLSWLVALLVTLALAGWMTSGVRYGDRNRVRAVVEQHSVLGRFLLRRYARITDMDGDGHSWAFGGRDCDDFNPNVYPGAYDLPGDGIDADCFAGDGSPDVADLADGRYGRRPRELGARPNILVITIDALRPDHLGVAGYERDVTPNLDRFAEDSVRFETVIAQSSRSLRSIPSMWTGFYPSQIAYGPEYLWPSLRPENVTAAEVLREAGYRTAVTMGTDYFGRLDGFFQGFDEVEQSPHYKPERDETVDRAIARLEGLAERGEPFLHWVHLFHVHAPYLRPPIPSRFGPRAVDGYDTEIQIADTETQRLLDALERLELDDRTVVIIASDHGEAFGEHGVEGHSTTLYEEELRSVLMIRSPGVRPRVVPEPVALFDVGPTILNLTNLRYPAPIPARSLVPAMTGERAPDESRLIFSELMPDGLFPFDIKAVRRGSMKLQWWIRDGTFQLFDLERDPFERNDLSDSRRSEALELLGLLMAWVAETNRPENQTREFVARHRLPAPPARMTHPTQIRVPGVFTLLGFDLPRTRYRPGETIPLDFYYRVDAETSQDLFLRVVIDGPPGYVVPPNFHGMHFPLHSRYPTTMWRRGEILRDPVPIVVPHDIPTPVTLRIEFAVQIRDAGLLGLEVDGTRKTNTTLAEIEILPARPGDREGSP